MERLRDKFNKLVQKTLTMEDPRIKNEPTATDYMTTLQSQPMYDSDNAVDYSEEQQVTEKSEDFSQQKGESKIVIDIESRILPLELNILQLELNLEIFCLISHTLVLVKMTFIMKISSWTSTCCSLKI